MSNYIQLWLQLFIKDFDVIAFVIFIALVVIDVLLYLQEGEKQK